MTATALLITVFLTNGTPLPNFFIVPPGVTCDGSLAVEYARKFIAPSLGGLAQIQDPTEHGFYNCFPVPEPIAPGPADPGAQPPPEEPAKPLSKQRDAIRELDQLQREARRLEFDGLMFEAGGVF